MNHAHSTAPAHTPLTRRIAEQLAFDIDALSFAVPAAVALPYTEPVPTPARIIDEDVTGAILPFDMAGVENGTFELIDTPTTVPCKLCHAPASRQFGFVRDSEGEGTGYIRRVVCDACDFTEVL